MISAGQNMQLEKVIEDIFKRNEFLSLEQFLGDQCNENTKHKCTKDFINKLDTVICREFEQHNAKNVLLMLTCVLKCGRSLNIQGCDGIAIMLKQGLVEKMLIWFENAKKWWIEGGAQKNAILLHLAEVFFDIIMMVHENNNEGKKQIIKVFLHRTGQLIAEQDIHISIQKEAIQRLNMILDKISKENKKDLFSSAEILNVMGCLGKQITVTGDYDLQVSITEALCRMATSKQRQKLADQCFSMECAAKAFKRIKDSTFETDCRVFLNLINDLQGNERSVCTYPCMEVLLDKIELLMPVDEKLHDFWIDFNIGSQSISFYISSQDNEQESLWETVYIPEEDVENYTVEEMEGKKKLRIVMKHYLRIGRTEGIQICIVFKAVLNILEAAMKVFGSKKYRKVPGKHRNSVVKTTVQVIFEDQGSQVIVPESQLSQTPDGKEKPLKEKRKCSQPTQIIPLATESTPRVPIKQTLRNKRVSESSLIISDRRQRSAKKSDKCIMSLSISSLKKKAKPRLELQDYSEHSTNSSICKPKSKGLYVSVSADKETEIDESKMKVITEENDAEIVRDTCFRMSTDKQLADSVEVDSHPLEKKARHLVPCEIKQIFEPSEFVTPAHRSGQHLGPSLESHLSKQKSCSVDSADQLSPKQKRYKQSAFSSVTCAHLTEEFQDMQKKRNCRMNAVKEVSLVESKASKPIAETFCNPKCTMLNGEKTKINTCVSSTCVPAVRSPHYPETNPQGIYKDSSSHRQDNGIKEPWSNCFGITETMISSISSKYTSKRNHPQNTSVLNSSDKENLWSFSFTERTTKYKKTKKTTFQPKSDVYRFVDDSIEKSKSEEEGRASLTDKKKTSHHKSKKVTAKTLVEKKTVGHSIKKHLFSDSDNDQIEEDSKTDLSWLQECNRKKRSAMYDYSKQSNAKGAKSCNSSKYSQPYLLSDIQKEETKENKKTFRKKKTMEENMSSKTQRPRRAAARNRRYKEISSSSSSEEFSSSSVKKTNMFESTINREKRKNDVQVPQMNNEYIFQQQEKRDIAMPHVASISSVSSSIEKMRSEKSALVDIASESALYSGCPSHTEDCLNTHKGILPTKFCKSDTIASKKAEIIPFEDLTKSSKISLQESDNVSVVLSSPQLASPNTYPETPAEKSKDVPRNNPGIEDQENEDVNSVLSYQSQCSSLEQVKTPVSAILNELRNDSYLKHSNNIYISGPSYTAPLTKKRLQADNWSFEDDEHNLTGKKLKPKKLFKLNTCKAADSEVHSMLSSAEMNLSCWEENTDREVGMMCHKFSSELKRKFQNRARTVEYYNKQSLKSIQQHLSAINTQIHECRFAKLDNFIGIIKEQLENLEKDSFTLKNMEIDLIDFRKKQTQDFAFYREKEQQRIHKLKTSYKESFAQSLEVEEKIFGSEIDFMKKDMNAVLERLLKEMHEEELHSVRRGLQSLFFLEDQNF